MDKQKQHLLLSVALLSGLCYPTTISAAEDQDFATDINVGAKKSLNKRIDVELGGGARLKNNSTELDRLSAEGGVGVTLLKKWLDFGAGYVFIADWNGRDDNYYSYRHRYDLGLDLYHKVTRRLEMDLRLKWQSTFRVETEKSYKWNPKNYLRLKLGGDYKVPKYPVNAYMSVEGFYSANNPDGNTIDDMRYNLGAKYHLNKRNTFDLGFQIDQEINVSKPSNRFMLCVGYKHKF